ncbi:MAG TPA: phage tail length tape measure family protein, partial [Sphingomicrobium sp.]|nr:phage tail length tape measure family protein [Sphingomicrobium sp.]
SRQYVEGYGAASRFNTALNLLQRGVESGNVSMERAGLILQGLHAKYGLMADATHVASKGNTQLAEVIERTNAHLRATVPAADAAGKAVGNSGHQIQQLGYQLQDVVASLGSGSSPFTIMMQQGGQVYSALQGPGGVGEGLRNVGGFLRSLVTPATVAGTALVGAAALGYQAWSRYSDLQKEILRTTQGFGAYLGLTVSQFQNLAQQASAAGGISVARATEIANALARTGNIDATNIAHVVALTKDFAATFTGGNLNAATERLAQGFGTGAAGLTAMVQQLKLFRGPMLEQYETLVRQNRIQDAILLVTDAMKGRLVSYEETTSKVAGLWERVKTIISDADLALGRMIDKGPGVLAAAAAAVSAATAKMDTQTFAGAFGGAEPSMAARAAAAPSTVPLPPRRPDELKEAKKSLDDFTDSVNRYREAEKKTADESALNTRMQEQIDLFRKNRDELVVGSDAYKKNLDTVSAWKDVMDRGTDAQKKELLSMKDATEAMSVATQVHKSLTSAQGQRMTAAELAAEADDLALASVKARTTEERASLAVRQIVAQQRGQAITQEQALAQQIAARTRILAEDSQKVQDWIKDQDMAAERLKLERDLLLASAEARAVAIAKLEQEQALRKAGLSTTTPGAQELISKAGNGAAYKLTTDTISKGFEDAKRSVSDFASSFATDMSNGVKAAEALANAAKKVGQSLIQGGISQGIQGLATGNYVQAGIGGAMAVTGLVMNSMGPSEKSKQRKQQMLDVWAKAQQDEFDAIQKQQEAVIQAGIEAAKAAEKAAEEAARAAEEAQRRIEAIARRTEGYQDRAFGAGLDTSTLQGQLAAFDRRTQREIEQEYRDGGEAINDLIAAQQAERLRIERDFTKQQADQQKQALKELQDFYDQQRQTIREFIDDLQGGSGSTLAPGDRLGAAQSAFDRQAALAQAGDRNALQGITGYANNLLEAARGMYASGGSYQAIYQRVLAILQALMGGSAVASATGTNPAGSSAVKAAANTNAPAASVPFVSFDNSAVVNELRALRQENAQLRTAVDALNRTVADGSNAIVAAEHETRNAVVASGTSQARETRLAARAA